MITKKFTFSSDAQAIQFANHINEFNLGWVQLSSYPDKEVKIKHSPELSDRIENLCKTLGGNTKS